MANICKQCGGTLTERDAFCRKCGAPRPTALESTPAPRFCTKCGAALSAETKFCTKCGVPLGVAAATGTEARDLVVTGAARDAAAGTPSTKSSTGIPKPALIGVAVVALVVVIALLAGAINATHRAREKAQETRAAQKFEKSLEKLASSGKSAPQSENNASLANVEKNINDLANAANALGQNAEKQGGASPGGMAGTAPSAPPAPGSTSPSPSTSAPNAGSLAANAAIPTADTALIPPPVPAGPPMVPVAGTGDPKHDWPLEYERTVGGPEADLVVRTGDINNLGFGWPKGFDPFSGQSTPIHPGPNIYHIPRNAPPGTDRIMLGTGQTPVHMIVQHTAGKPDQVMIDSLIKTVGGDGYSQSLASCFMLEERVLWKTGDKS